MVKQHYKQLLFSILLALFATMNLQAQATLSIEGVADIYALSALFGPQVSDSINAEIVLAVDANIPENDGCSEIVNDVQDKIVVIDRGECGFVGKALNAQNAGAAAVVICNNDAANPTQLILLSGDDMGLLSIPTVHITFAACEAIKTALNDGMVMATLVPSANNLCVAAEEIEPGTYTVEEITADPVLGGLGGAPSNPGDDDATAAVWYSYTPPADGIMTVNSCEGGADTRLWIHTGSCDILGLNLVTLAQNDDACIFDPSNLEDEYASFVSLPVQGGITYLIEWDNRWSDGPFDFTLAFEEVEIVLAPGQVCDSAIVIQPGTYTVDSITPYGQTGLYNTNGSQWYSFTPEFTGLMSINSCGGGSDTRLIVHEGSCSAPEEVAFSDDACPASEDDDDEVASSVEGLAVTAGNTYYIEWSGRWEIGPFDFTLTLDSLPVIPVTFTVDMSLQEVSEEGVQMVWAFATPDTLDDVNIVELSDDDGDNRWTATLNLTTLDTIGFAYVNGEVAVENIESVPEDCSVDSGFGFRVRPLIVTEIDSQAVEVFCFGFCRSCGPENCDEPFVLIDDDFESYQLGALGPQSDFWTTWSGEEGGNEDGIVSDEQANSGAQSMKIEGDNGPQDVLLQLGDQTAGHYILSWNMYIPRGEQGYYNIQKVEGEPGEAFGVQVSFEADSTLSIDAGEASAATGNFTPESWFEVTHYIDLNNDNIRLYIDGNFIYAWTFSFSSFTEEGPRQLGAVDFFPAEGSHLYYIDDVYFAEIPPAGEGQYVQTAVEVEAGTHTVPELSCFGAGFNVRSNGNGGAGYWYEYEATADGYIIVNSCNGGIDTRLWVFGGDTQNLPTLGVNDDLCPIEPDGDAFASYREVPVTAGETYYILFDNPWENDGFEWSLELVEGELPAGNFCQSAIAIEPGVTTIDTLDGNAAVAGPSIGVSLSNSYTPYANTEWYSFTPPADGTMSVFSCETLPEATRVYVYDGSCGIEDLDLLAFSSNSCDPTSPTQSIAVEEGVTYYIEWASKFDGARFGFDFTLEFGAPAVNVTFQVDMSILAENGELSEQGAFIGGEFNNFEAVPMTLSDEPNVYTFTVPLMKGDTVEYNFFNGPFDQEEIDPSFGDDCVLDAFGGRFIVVGEMEMTVEEVCFGFCVSCEATGIEDLAFAQSLIIFPNPAQERTIVQYEFDELTDLDIRLSNVLGQLIRTQQISGVSSGQYELDLTGLPSGTYQLSIQSGVRVRTVLLMIE